MGMIGRRATATVFALLLLMAVSAGAQSAPWLVTAFTRDVNADRVLPEYPRPQLERARWQSLNGQWDYAIRDRTSATPDTYDGNVLVPFPIESRLSGVRRRVSPEQIVWYRRTFDVAAPAGDTRWLLHFGAVDWDATVFVNGTEVGTHRGGYDPFSFDVTDALAPNGPQEVVVRVWDPTDHGDQPRGKQVLDPKGIWYTAVTGIWQTVWLEPVPTVHITDLRIGTDIHTGVVSVRATVAGADAGERVRAVALIGRTPVAEATGGVLTALALSIPSPRLWSPDDPYLYGLRVSLSSGDSVDSYFGMREITVMNDSLGVPRLALNGHPLFEFGLLDQGWWPDGLYTAPTDAALRYDLVVTKRLGYNLIRKHVKVEPERWYYHADRLGILVWQDMPSGNNTTDSGRAEFARELDAVIEARRNHPAIVMWVPFNEGWGQHGTEEIVARVQALDSTRLVDDASGWTDRGVGNVHDIHEYPGPARPDVESHRAAVLGEFGGLGLPIAGHLWNETGAWGYRRYRTLDDLGEAYLALIDRLRLLEAEGLAAAVYTQTTDVETEVNGIMTYDREVVKLPFSAATRHATLYAPLPRIRTVVPTSRDRPQRWRYTTAPPPAAWYRADFDDRGWQVGSGGFGTDSTPGAHVRTEWNTSDLWLRRMVELRDADIEGLHLRVHHDEDAEVYVNGTLAARLAGYTVGYELVPLAKPAAAMLHAGMNVVAVHVHQTRGGQYIDVGFAQVIDQEEP